MTTAFDLPDILFVLMPPARENGNGDCIELSLAVYGGHEMVLAWPTLEAGEAWLALHKEPARILEIGWASLMGMIESQDISAIAYGLNPGEGTRDPMPEDRLVWKV